MASTFRGVIEFMNKVGLYDVVLPFLLVFTVVFGVLEKTKVLGTVKVEDVIQPKKNLNAMIAFVVAFFVVASVELVEMITEVSAHVTLMILFIFFFLIMVGMLVNKDKGFELEGVVAWIFYGIAFVVLVLIFFGALGWLDKIGEWLTEFWTNEYVAAIVLLIIVVGFMAAITGGSKKSKPKED